MEVSRGWVIRLVIRTGVRTWVQHQDQDLGIRQTRRAQDCMDQDWAWIRDRGGVFEEELNKRTLIG